MWLAISILMASTGYVLKEQFCKFSISKVAPLKKKTCCEKFAGRHKKENSKKPCCGTHHKLIKVETKTVAGHKQFYQFINFQVGNAVILPFKLPAFVSIALEKPYKNPSPPPQGRLIICLKQSFQI